MQSSAAQTLRRTQRRSILIILLVALLAIALLVFSCFAGVANVTPGRLVATIAPHLAERFEPLSQTEITVLLHLRLPRIVMALLAGMGLAVSGLMMQAITGNTMASPFTTGISNAAAMGAALVIVFGARIAGGGAQVSMVLGAFIMAFVCAALVYGISAIKGLGNTTIVLVGIALNYLFSAMNAGMQYLASEQQLATIINWTFGNLSQASWVQVLFTAGVLLLALPYAQSRAWSYNLLTTGDESALALGVNVGRTRLISGLMITLTAATIVSFTGVIGFVGLVAPHIARLLVGGDYRKLMPLSALCGGALLMAADLIGRTIASPVVVPVGIVVSFIGVPLFIYLIMQNRKGHAT